MRLLLILALTVAALAQDGLELGSPSQRGCQMVYHTGFALCYNEEHEQAQWVAYVLTRDEARGGKASRKGMDFDADDAVTTGSATKDDYRKSGYDKGHLAPAADMKWSVRAMRESFLLSNASPQVHEFNAGVWEDLERETRELAMRLGAVNIITGPVLTEDLPTIGKNKVSVPRYYFKVLLHDSGGTYRALAFLMPNEFRTDPFTAFAVPVDSVEAVTGLDFFNVLDDGTEGRIEGTRDVGWWFPGVYNPDVPARKKSGRR